MWEIGLVNAGVSLRAREMHAIRVGSKGGAGHPARGEKRNCKVQRAEYDSSRKE